MAVEEVMNRITALSDADAIRILSGYVRGSGLDAPSGLAIRDLRDASRAAIGSDSEAPVQKAGDGDVARAALCLAAADPQTAVGINTLIDAPESKSFLVTEVSVLTLAVAVLMTRANISKTPKGWKIELSKPALSTAQLTAFLKTITGWFGPAGQ